LRQQQKERRRTFFFFFQAKKSFLSSIKLFVMLNSMLLLIHMIGIQRIIFHSMKIVSQEKSHRKVPYVCAIRWTNIIGELSVCFRLVQIKPKFSIKLFLLVHLILRNVSNKFFGQLIVYRKVLVLLYIVI